jgi:hypothetical protein
MMHSIGEPLAAFAFMTNLLYHMALGAIGGFVGMGAVMWVLYRIASR